MNSATSTVLRAVLCAVVISGFLCAVPWVGDAQAQRTRVEFGDDEEEGKVEGYVHRPEVTYIVSRKEQEDLETLQLKESFLPKVIKSVEKKPF